jgi:hypothetical protein
LISGAIAAVREPPFGIPGRNGKEHRLALQRKFGLFMQIPGEPTSGLEPLTSSHYECAVSGCWALHTLANLA